MGVAFYTPVAAEYFKGTTGTRPLLYKSISPPINDFNFRSLCANTQTKCVIAHIRASSGSAVVQTNCHPFVFGRHVRFLLRLRLSTRSMLMTDIVIHA